MSKKIIIIGINYYPEDSAIGLYTTQKAEYLVEKGFFVSVITGFPYYPQWKINKEYTQTNKKFIKENINGIDVYRFRQYVPNYPTFFKRVLHLISFTLGSIINLFKVSKPDVIIAIVPFTTSIFLGWLLKLRYRSKLWVHIQDFEFDAAIESGLLSKNSKLIVNTLLWIEKKVLNKADIVSTISKGMMKKLKKKSNIKQYYLPNWIDISLFRDINETHPYISSSKFCILYSGNIGTKQDWDFFFRFTKNLQEFNNIEIVVVGEGAEKEKVVKEIEKYDFVKHYNLVPFDELPLLLSSANLHILFQKTEVIDAVMPSKILGMMASGRPSLIVGNPNSEIAEIYGRSSAGYFFDNNSHVQIIDCIQNLISNESLCKELGVNAKNYVIKNFSKTEVLNNFIKEIEQI